ncbi:hypothetical protein Dsin_013387 [Dipteronia sinensis]|uniref:Uncharacterized protein n=1 Tax=Dipteronia sinensis TaxID=43782 RepID=A0AAE0AL26_9ROSI|nr:hypothetical protein Dsin_013387 [Dipteronia sinensis]
MKVAAMLVPIILLFCTTVIISAFVFHDHHHRKVFVGTVGLVAAVTMCGSPLVVVEKGTMEEPNKWDIEQNEEKSKLCKAV